MIKILPPLYQGAYGAMCGAYAAVNAVRYLCGLDNESSRTVLREMIDKHEHVLRRAYGVGMDDGEVSYLIADACRASVPGWRLGWDRTHVLVDTPEQFLHRMRLDRDAVASEDRRTVHVVGLGFPDFHWTVVRRSGPLGLLLYDSAGHRVLPVDRLSMRRQWRKTQLEGRQVFRLTAQRVTEGS